MPQYITTHDANGRAVFHQQSPLENVKLLAGKGSMEIISTTHSFPTDVSADSDIKAYLHDRIHGLAPTNPICPPNGTSTAFINIEPNGVSPMHRTMTLDVLCVLAGTLELHLDSGEKRVLHVGDTIVQRATMHKWVNVTPGGGWARVFACGQPVKTPLVVAGREVGGEWLSAEGRELL